MFKQVLQLEQQILIWIGESPASLSELAVGIPAAGSPASRYHSLRMRITLESEIFAGSGIINPDQDPERIWNLALLNTEHSSGFRIHMCFN